MTDKSENPLGMIRDPFAGDLFILPDTLCTDQRKAFFHRFNEILKFLYISDLALVDCKSKYAQFLSNDKLKIDTPLKLAFSDGQSTIMPVCSFLNGCNNGVEFLCRQVFVMFYGSWETYLFQILERSFPLVGIAENILEKALGILMSGSWDGKFCKMQNTPGIDYKASDLISHFKGFEMDYGGKIFKNPFDFLDEMAHIRHRIVHYSSMMENGEPIFINFQQLPSLFSFYAHLTEYVDKLYSNKFNYTQLKINPAEA